MIDNTRETIERENNVYMLATYYSKHICKERPSTDEFRKICNKLRAKLYPDSKRNAV